MIDCFNPTLVRFCPGAPHVREMRRHGFNPTLVRFCLGFRMLAATILCGFNPTLVRFCPWQSPIIPLHTSLVSIPPWFDFAPGSACPLSYREPSFQSHLGSILPPRSRWRRPPRRPFQSHLGSILPGIHDAVCVRLDPFQSHLGSILPRYVIEKWLPQEGFNPTLVRFCRI